MKSTRCLLSDLIINLFWEAGQCQRREARQRRELLIVQHVTLLRQACSWLYREKYSPGRYWANFLHTAVPMFLSPDPQPWASPDPRSADAPQFQPAAAALTALS